MGASSQQQTNQLFGQTNQNMNGQNQQFQNQGGQPGLLSNPVRDTSKKLAAVSLFILI